MDKEAAMQSYGRRRVQEEEPEISKLKGPEAQTGLVCSGNTEYSQHSWSLMSDGECDQRQG